jgi:hypothetical protein
MLLEENPDAEKSELLRLVRECADDYTHYFIQDRLDKECPHLSSIDAVRVLSIGGQTNTDFSKSLHESAFGKLFAYFFSMKCILCAHFLHTLYD